MRVKPTLPGPQSLGFEPLWYSASHVYQDSYYGVAPDKNARFWSHLRLGVRMRACKSHCPTFFKINLMLILIFLIKKAGWEMKVTVNWVISYGILLYFVNYFKLPDLVTLI